MMRSTGSPIPMADRLAVLAEPIRMRMVRILEQHELTVGEVASVAQMPQSTVSRHLKSLADAGWIKKRSAGTATLYSASADDMSSESAGVWASVAVSLDQTDPVLAEDDRRVSSVLDARKTDSRSYFGRVAGTWDEVRTSLFGEQFTALGLLGLLRPDLVVADFGCGTGNASEILSPHVGKVLAIDESDAMLEAAEKRLAGCANIEFVQQPADSTGLGTSSVDASVAVLLLHHIEEPRGVIDEMARVTKPGGVVLVIDMHEHREHSFRRSMGHRHLGFSTDDVESMFEHAGVPGPTVKSLPSPAETRGPGLFVATGVVPGRTSETPLAAGGEARRPASKKKRPRSRQRSA